MRHVKMRKRHEIALREHPAKGPTRLLNYGGEIRYVGSLRRFRDHYTRLRLRMNRSSFSSSLRLTRFFFPSYFRIRERLRGCVIASKPPLKRERIYYTTRF